MLMFSNSLVLATEWKELIPWSSWHAEGIVVSLFIGKMANYHGNWIHIVINPRSWWKQFCKSYITYHMNLYLSKHLQVYQTFCMMPFYSSIPWATYLLITFSRQMCQDHGDGILMSKQNNVAETYRNHVAVTKWNVSGGLL